MSQRPKVEMNEMGAILIGGEIAADGPCHGRTLFVSHAHSDHLGGLKKRMGGRTVVCTAPTYDLAAYALGFRPWGVRVVEYNRPVELSEEKLTLYPSTHILGSAQALVETKHGSVVYTGDFKQPNTPIIEADVLVIEATYGAPSYTREVGDAEVALVEAVEKHVKEGPVCVYGYASKVQEALSILKGFVDADFLLDRTCEKVAQIYLKHGFKLPRYRPLNGEKPGSGCVIFKTLKHAGERFEGIKIILTGWSPRLVAKIRGGYMIRLSDHADYTQLLEYVECAKPKVVYTDGWRSNYAAVFAKEIERRLGIRAYPLPGWSTWR